MVYMVVVITDCFKCLKIMKLLYIGKCVEILLVSRTAAKSRHVAAKQSIICGLIKSLIK